MSDKNDFKMMNFLAEGEGRPKKTLGDLPDDWQDKLLEMGSEGCAVIEMRTELGVCEQLFNRFIKDEPEFSRTVQYAKDLSQKWWMESGREIGAKRINTGLYALRMKNCYGWADKKEVKIEADIKDSLAPEKVLEMARQLSKENEGKDE